MRRAPTHRWRGGRVAEGGGLLNRYTVNPVSWVRIPSPPPPRHSHLFVVIRKVKDPCCKRRLAIVCRLILSRSARMVGPARTCDVLAVAPERASKSLSRADG